MILLRISIFLSFFKTPRPSEVINIIFCLIFFSKILISEASIIDLPLLFVEG